MRDLKTEKHIENTDTKSRDLHTWARPRDLLIIGIVALIAAALIFLPGLLSRTDDVRVLIYYKGDIIDEFIMTEGTSRVLSYKENDAVLIQQWADKSIAFVRSDCPDQICVNSGRLRMAGQFAACLPNSFVIVLEAVSQSEGVDLIA